jgi:hypothetical protein
MMRCHATYNVLLQISAVAMQTWAPHIIRLLEEPEIGVLLGATALLLGVVSSSYHGVSGSWKPDVACRVLGAA